MRSVPNLTTNQILIPKQKSYVLQLNRKIIWRKEKKTKRSIKATHKADSNTKTIQDKNYRELDGK